MERNRRTWLAQKWYWLQALLVSVAIGSLCIGCGVNHQQAQQTFGKKPAPGDSAQAPDPNVQAERVISMIQNDPGDTPAQKAAAIAKVKEKYPNAHN